MWTTSKVRNAIVTQRMLYARTILVKVRTSTWHAQWIKMFADRRTSLIWRTTLLSSFTRWKFHPCMSVRTRSELIRRLVNPGWRRLTWRNQAVRNKSKINIYLLISFGTIPRLVAPPCSTKWTCMAKIVTKQLTGAFMTSKQVGNTTCGATFVKWNSSWWTLHRRSWTTRHSTRNSVALLYDGLQWQVIQRYSIKFRSAWLGFLFALSPFTCLLCLGHTWMAGSLWTRKQIQLKRASRKWRNNISSLWKIAGVSRTLMCLKMKVDYSINDWSSQISRS